MERMERQKAYGFIFRRERIHELNEIITAAILAKRHAQSETERERLNRIINRASTERAALQVL